MAEACVRWSIGAPPAEGAAADALVWILPPSRSCHLLEEGGLASDRVDARRRRTAMMARLASMRLGREIGPQAVRRDPDGRPHIRRAPRLFLSAAERDGWTAAAIGGRAVGIDIEAAEPASPLPLDLLHPDERRYLEGKDARPRAAAFARLWTAKEAWAKAFSRPIDKALAAQSRCTSGELAIAGTPVVFRRVADRLAALVLAP